MSLNVLLSGVTGMNAPDFSEAFFEQAVIRTRKIKYRIISKIMIPTCRENRFFASLDTPATSPCFSVHAPAMVKPGPNDQTPF